MKTKLIFIAFMVTFAIKAQSNRDIANIYFKKAERAMERIDYSAAKVNFDKGVKSLDSITTEDVAQQGAFIYYELKYYEEAKDFAVQFFNLSRSKTSESYTQMLELYVDMEEKILEKKQEEIRLVEEKKAKEKELKKIDSLKNVWAQKEKAFVLEIDSIYSFNKKGIALYEKDGFYGIMNDVGEILTEADTYKGFKQNEGYILLMNKQENPDKIYCYNSETDKSIIVTNPSNFEDDLEGYGTVTMPRGNGRLVMYPNDIGQTVVYDLEEEKFVKIKELKTFFKEFKKAEKIDKYDEKERTVKIGKEWYLFGNNLGGQVYSLDSLESRELKSFLFAGNGEEEPKVVEKSAIGYLGIYYSNKLEATKSNGETVWLTKSGKEGSKPSFNNKYKGKTKVVKVSGGYQFTKDGKVFLKNDSLDKLPDFLRKNK